MNQPNLFDTSPTDDLSVVRRRARKNDPGTSHSGAAHIESSAGYLQGLFLETLKKSVRPMTANEVAAECSAVHQVMTESVRKRAKELERTGSIEVAGERRCNVTGRQAQTYKCRTS